MNAVELPWAMPTIDNAWHPGAQGVHSCSLYLDICPARDLDRVGENYLPYAQSSKVSLPGRESASTQSGTLRSSAQNPTRCNKAQIRIKMRKSKLRKTKHFHQTSPSHPHSPNIVLRGTIVRDCFAGQVNYASAHLLNMFIPIDFLMSASPPI
jgi:hypothetical protein